MPSISEHASQEALIDPFLLKHLTPEQRAEALEAAATAKRAEERAEQRALERALKRKQEEREREKESTHITSTASTAVATSNARIKFVSKRQREKQKEVLAKEACDVAGNGAEQNANNNQNKSSTNTRKPVAPPILPSVSRQSYLADKELAAIKRSYLGKSIEEQAEDDAKRRKKDKRTLSKFRTFKFRWDDTDDTFDNDDPLYASLPPPKNSAISGPTKLDKMGKLTSFASVQTKPIEKMTARDWRIFRENFEISVRGGKVPPPMRLFRESPSPDIPCLHPSLLDAIENVLKFREPSPIQRQAIPIGLQRRDLIGIAETGSGKTVAFGVPLCHYLLHLPERVLNGVADNGPLALVMAPTRELALQIDVELDKLLSRQRNVSTCAVVGGQPIQQQAQRIRKGVHIIVGTPGRINDCIEMAYLVLNQCSYIILDEADRMIDMGFAPQMESILDAMGGKLKSENEAEAYQQELDDLQKNDVAEHRVTAMFSATMPAEVEQLAKQYLRHPSIISVGDEDSRKNSRIEQKIVWLSSPKLKEKALRDQLMHPRFRNDKVLVFVNEKKHADGVGRMIERAGRRCVVLHGGKSQEQREESLEAFRKGGLVMCATDVMGRGVDVPNVALVINFDLPTRSIENYTHRIGRTGRAGKDGFAVSFITDEDEGIMAPLKKHLESTKSEVPERLARHPAANSASGNALIY